MFDVSSSITIYGGWDLIAAIVLGIIGGIFGGLYNFLLDKILRTYSIINEYVCYNSMIWAFNRQCRLLFFP